MKNQKLCPNVVQASKAVEISYVWKSEVVTNGEKQPKFWVELTNKKSNLSLSNSPVPVDRRINFHGESWLRFAIENGND